MNDQLYKDIKKNEKEVITTAAKWVPREGSKFSWLFTLLMENWTRRYTPYLFPHAVNGSNFLEEIRQHIELTETTLYKLPQHHYYQIVWCIPCNGLINSRKTTSDDYL